MTTVKVTTHGGQRWRRHWSHPLTTASFPSPTDQQSSALQTKQTTGLTLWHTWEVGEKKWRLCPVRFKNSLKE